MAGDDKPPYVIPPVLASALAPFRPADEPEVKRGNEDLVCERGTGSADVGTAGGPSRIEVFGLRLRRAIEALEAAKAAGRRAGVSAGDLELLSASIDRVETVARYAGVSVLR